MQQTPVTYHLIKREEINPSKRYLAILLKVARKRLIEDFINIE